MLSIRSMRVSVTLSCVTALIAIFSMPLFAQGQQPATPQALPILNPR
jgi:hypothetical protein